MLFRNIDTTPFQPEWNELLWARPIPSSLSIIYLGVSKNAISKMGMIGTIFLYNTQHAMQKGLILGKLGTVPGILSGIGRDRDRQ